MIMKNETANILDLLNAQEGNVIKGLLNLGQNVNAMSHLDKFFEYPLERHTTAFNKNETLIASLYLETHKGYCLCMINFLRSNISVSLMILRKTIEASLTAYHLCKHPDDGEIFSNRKHPRYRELFWNIKKYVEDRPKEYPLAKMLTKAHDTSSRYASHSTAEAHFINVHHEKGENGKDSFTTLDFTEVLDHVAFEGWYLHFLQIFVACYEIFWKEFFGKKFVVIDPNYDERYAKFCHALETRIRKHPIKKGNI